MLFKVMYSKNLQDKLVGAGYSVQNFLQEQAHSQASRPIAVQTFRYKNHAPPPATIELKL